MNYIKSLEMTLKCQEIEIKGLYSLLSDIQSYLESDKFAGQGDDYVNVRDILSRIQQGRSAILDQVLGPVEA